MERRELKMKSFWQRNYDKELRRRDNNKSQLERMCRCGHPGEEHMSQSGITICRNKEGWEYERCPCPYFKKAK